MPSRLPATLLALALCTATPAQPTSPQPPDMAQVMKALGTTSRDRITDFTTSRLNRDRQAQTIVITNRTHEGGHPLGGEIIVLEARPAPSSPATSAPPLKVVWRQRNLNPWKLAIADVDGDGQREIAVGVWKKSPKDPVMAKRTFFYTWDGRQMRPKWLGSRLSRRFNDFTLGDVNRDGWDELIALEVAPNGRHRIAAYRWHSFGFEWLGGTAALPGLSRLDNVDGKAVASGERGRATVTVSHSKVALVRQAGR